VQPSTKEQAIMNKATRNTARRQRGQGMMEYMIVVAFMAVAAIGVWGYFGTIARTQVAGLVNQVSGQPNAANMQVTIDGQITAATNTMNNKVLGAPGGPTAPLSLGTYAQ
jgi:Tfp pilus assembly protein PilV